MIRALDGDRTVRLRKPDRIEVVRRWKKQGRSLKSLAAMTGWKVERYLEEAS